jgi:hypothetical protein
VSEPVEDDVCLNTVKPAMAFALRACFDSILPAVLLRLRFSRRICTIVFFHCATTR